MSPDWDAVVRGMEEDGFAYLGRWATAEEMRAMRDARLPDPLPLRHAGNARLLTEVEIRQREAETGHRL